jgi:hypothetical protein
MQGGRIFSVDQSLQQTTTMNHLETQMAASLFQQFTVNGDSYFLPSFAKYRTYVCNQNLYSNADSKDKLAAICVSKWFIVVVC